MGEKKGGCGEECGCVACLGFTLFGLVLSCHFRVVTAQTERKTPVMAGNWGGRKVLHVWSVKHPISQGAAGLIVSPSLLVNHSVSHQDLSVFFFLSC